MGGLKKVRQLESCVPAGYTVQCRFQWALGFV